MSALGDMQEFLQDWAKEAKLVTSLIPDSVMNQSEVSERFGGGVLNEPASMSEISRMQARISAALPSEVTEFYGVTNGMRVYGFDEYDIEIAPTQSVRLLSDCEMELVRAISSYAEDDAIPVGSRRLFAKSEISRLLVLSTPCASGAYILNLGSGVEAPSCYAIRYKGTPKKHVGFFNLLRSERERCTNALRELLD